MSDNIKSILTHAAKKEIKKHMSTMIEELNNISKKTPTGILPKILAGGLQFLCDLSIKWCIPLEVKGGNGECDDEGSMMFSSAISSPSTPLMFLKVEEKRIIIETIPVTVKNKHIENFTEYDKQFKLFTSIRDNQVWNFYALIMYIVNHLNREMYFTDLVVSKESDKYYLEFISYRLNKKIIVNIDLSVADKDAEAMQKAIKSSK